MVKPDGFGRFHVATPAPKTAVVKPLVKPVVKPDGFGPFHVATKPPVVKAKTAKPDGSPAVVEPAIVKPAVVKPAVVKPAVVKPAVVKPAVVKPAVVEPKTAVVKPVVEAGGAAPESAAVQHASLPSRSPHEGTAPAPFEHLKVSNPKPRTPNPKP